eukprot:9296590-Ditylum_brightwellii.AAC.1
MSTVKGMAAAAGNTSNAKESKRRGAEAENIGAPPTEGANKDDAPKSVINVEKLTPLLIEANHQEKKRLLSEGFTDWGANPLHCICESKFTIWLSKLCQNCTRSRKTFECNQGLCSILLGQ